MNAFRWKRCACRAAALLLLIIYALVPMVSSVSNAEDQSNLLNPEDSILLFGHPLSGTDSAKIKAKHLIEEAKKEASEDLKQLTNLLAYSTRGIAGRDLAIICLVIITLVFFFWFLTILLSISKQCRLQLNEIDRIEDVRKRWLRSAQSA
eukprot:TRINITY_DN7120_c0_g1_i1.p1 TRINITY_DN7120_c0_g1~~TRINITY_DN7120_c0_g1_i1.p1  ORF type:complete len:150 (+),score=2.46 TRINITY_DN7120_c0_g1_i1:101-550(+)